MVNPVDITVYVTSHCETCMYAREVAETIRREYRWVNVRVVEMESAAEEIPEVVFATPTYLLGGQVWSLGNPSPEKIRDTFSA